MNANVTLCDSAKAPTSPASSASSFCEGVILFDSIGVRTCLCWMCVLTGSWKCLACSVHHGILRRYEVVDAGARTLALSTRPCGTSSTDHCTRNGCDERDQHGCESNPGRLRSTFLHALRCGRQGVRSENCGSLVCGFAVAIGLSFSKMLLKARDDLAKNAFELGGGRTDQRALY